MSSADFEDAGEREEVALALFDPAELAVEPPPSGSLAAASRWVRSYLTHPHPDLGRPGAVCPFVGPALERGSLRFGVVEGCPPPEKIDRIIERYRDAFLGAALCLPRSRQLLTFLVLFPDVATEDAPRVIDAAQERLKPAFVQAGLMVGQFHPGPPSEPGLWNPDFRPLAAPVPLLAIRHMHARDFLFLRDRPEFVRA